MSPGCEANDLSLDSLSPWFSPSFSLLLCNHTLTHTLTHSLSLVLVVMMRSKELKTSRSIPMLILRFSLSLLLHTLTHTPYHLYLLLMIKSKELKTKISHTHSLVLTLASLQRNSRFHPLILVLSIILTCFVCDSALSVTVLCL